MPNNGVGIGLRYPVRIVVVKCIVNSIGKRWSGGRRHIDSVNLGFPTTSPR